MDPKGEKLCLFILPLVIPLVTALLVFLVLLITSITPNEFVALVVNTFPIAVFEIIQRESSIPFILTCAVLGNALCFPLYFVCWWKLIPRDPYFEREMRDKKELPIMYLITVLLAAIYCYFLLKDPAGYSARVQARILIFYTPVGFYALMFFYSFIVLTIAGVIKKTVVIARLDK